LFIAFHDGSGKAPTYNLSGDTEITPVTRQGSRIAFKLPFGEPSAVFRPEGIEGEDPYGKDDVVTLHIESSDRDDPKKARGLLGVRHGPHGRSGASWRGNGIGHCLSVSIFRFRAAADLGAAQRISLADDTQKRTIGVDTGRPLILLCDISAAPHSRTMSPVAPKPHVGS
jgi:hypothetical protein